MYRVKLVAEVSHTPEEEEVVPHVVQLISPPFLGRTVLTAGPAKFGMDLTKQEHGVSFQSVKPYSVNIKAPVFNENVTNNSKSSDPIINFIFKLLKCNLFSFTCNSFSSPSL